MNLHNCPRQRGGLSGLLNTQSSSQGSGDDSGENLFMVNVPHPLHDSDGDGLVEHLVG